MNHFDILHKHLLNLFFDFFRLLTKITYFLKFYKLVLRTDPSPRAPLYQAEFLTTRDWKTHRFLPKDFKASFRGRSVDAPELVFSEVKEIGILIANKQAGTFRIQLKSLQSVSDTRR